MPVPLSSLSVLIRVAAGMLPALLIIVFAGLLVLAALPCGAERRAYTLAVVDRCIALAALAVGRPVIPVANEPTASAEKSIQQMDQPQGREGSRVME
jgi:hypothetical protein